MGRMMMRRASVVSMSLLALAACGPKPIDPGHIDPAKAAAARQPAGPVAAPAPVAAAPAPAAAMAQAAPKPANAPAPAADAPPPPAEAAAANIGACIWSRAPAQGRAAFMASFPQGQQPNPFGDEAALKRAYLACGAKPERGNPAGLALGGHMRRVAAAAKLSALYHVEEAKLADAWNALPQDRRARFGQHAANPAVGPDKEDVKVIDELTAKLGLKDEAGRWLVGAYLVARCMEVVGDTAFRESKGR